MLQESVVPIHPAEQDETDKFPFNSDRFQMFQFIWVFLS